MNKDRFLIHPSSLIPHPSSLIPHPSSVRLSPTSTDKYNKFCRVGSADTHTRIDRSKVMSQGLDLMFRNARTHNAWLDKPVEDALLRQVYDLAKMGPTSANMCPMRIVFVKSREAKERLKPALDAGNVDKTMAAPVTAILGMDIHFFEQLPKLFPHADAKAWFKELPDNVLEYIALRNSSLQGAYFMLAARSLGLDCGPMSGFDNAKVDATFFAGTTVKSNFLCNLGYGDASKLYPRSPRLDFEEACKLG